MILRKFKDYLRATKIANIRELSIYLRAQPEAVRAMAELLIRKKCLRQVVPNACDGGCQGCARQMVEVYEWVEEVVN